MADRRRPRRPIATSRRRARGSAAAVASISRAKAATVWVGGSSVTCIRGEVGSDARAVAQPGPPGIELDHLVVGARSLTEGVAWCEATLGVTPAAGGRHALMGTHNRLLALSSPCFPRSYLEIVAIDPEAPPPAQARWFDLDDAATQAALAIAPRLLHWVARTADIEAAAAWLRAAGHDPGVPTAAERMTERGLLRWRITLRHDGARPAGGAVPLLIEWSGAHPTDALPESGVSLERLVIGGVPASIGAALGVRCLGDCVGAGNRAMSGDANRSGRASLTRARVALNRRLRRRARRRISRSLLGESPGPRQSRPGGIACRDRRRGSASIAAQRSPRPTRAGKPSSVLAATINAREGFDLWSGGRATSTCCSAGPSLASSSLAISYWRTMLSSKVS